MKSYPKSIPITGRVRVCLEFLRSQRLKNKVVLDVGSTFGWLARELKSDHLKQYIGVEPNEAALQFAKKNVRSASFYSGDAANIPVEKKIANVAVFFDVIEHVPVNTEVACLKEINRVLKNNGVLLLSTPFDNFFTKVFDPAWYFGHRHYSKEVLVKMLKKSGFKLVHFEVRGGFISIFYMIVFYAAKWLFKKDINGSNFQKMDDLSYNKAGIATVYLVAKKVS